MQWLVSALITPVLNFIFNKVVLGIGALIRFITEYHTRKKIVEKDLGQAEVVEKIAEEIRNLVKAGKPVPAELEKRLVDESAKINLGEPFPK